MKLDVVIKNFFLCVFRRINVCFFIIYVVDYVKCFLFLYRIMMVIFFYFILWFRFFYLVFIGFISLGDFNFI